jgi:AmmeMemoRadiSam system protein B
VLAAEGYTTPLGTMPIDVEAVAALARQPLVHADCGPFAEEHALEIQLPFLQIVLPAARLVPVLVGRLRDADSQVLAASLRPALEDADTIVVVSSDFTHYGARFGYLPFPPTDDESVRRGLWEIDGGAMNLILGGDAEGFDDYVDRTGATICGRAAISLFLRARRAPGEAELLCYYTSLDVAGDREHSVSYGTVGFWDP